MIVFGVTGLIGSGKSSVLEISKALGAEIFNSDEYVRELYLKNHIIKIIQEKFPQAVVANRVDKKILKEIIFSNYLENIIILENILHPFVKVRIKFLIASFLKKELSEKTQRISSNSLEDRSSTKQSSGNQRVELGAQIIVLEIPLLFESGLNSLCDYVLYTKCSEEEILKRVQLRDNLSPEIIKMILIRQKIIKNKENLADFVINTENTKTNLKVELGNIFKQIQYAQLRKENLP